MLKALIFGCSIALLGTVGTAGAQDWTKSKWGPNDEIARRTICRLTLS